jgi:hypothetical protein
MRRLGNADVDRKAPKVRTGYTGCLAAVKTDDSRR